MRIDSNKLVRAHRVSVHETEENDSGSYLGYIYDPGHMAGVERFPLSEEQNADTVCPADNLALCRYAGGKGSAAGNAAHMPDQPCPGGLFQVDSCDTDRCCTDDHISSFEGRDSYTGKSSEGAL